MNHGLRRVQFVRAKGADERKRKGNVAIRKLTQANNDEEDGIQARSFYENLIASTSSDSSDQPGNRCKPASGAEERSNTRSHNPAAKDQKILQRKDSGIKVSKRTSERTHNELLRHCQEGNLREVKRVLTKEGAILRDCDQYGWNALMCAAYSGHKHIVVYIVKTDPAVLEHRNKKGQSALELAQMAGHDSVVGLLREFVHSDPSTGDRHGHSSSGQGSGGSGRPFWCEICKAEFRDRKRVHDRSTAHLFSCGHAPNQTLYYLPESNRGFQMMLQDGWDRERGLGKGGEGQKFPVKTILKRDRHGLGAPETDCKPRITHFKPFDRDAVTRPRKKMTNAEVGREKEKERRLSQTSKRKRHKAIEIDFRRSFNM